MMRLHCVVRHTLRNKAGCPAKSGSGFTLIELMITLAIAAVLLVVGVPSFIDFQRNSELTSQTNSLVAALNAAKTEAMKRNTNAYVVPGGSSNLWTDGWIVFADTDRTGLTFEADKDFNVLTQPAIPSYFTITATGTANETAPYVRFNSSGYPRNASGFGAVTLNVQRNDLTGAALLQQTRRIKIASTGRVRTCKPETSTDAKCTSGDD